MLPLTWMTSSFSIMYNEIPKSYLLHDSIRALASMMPWCIFLLCSYLQGLLIGSFWEGHHLIHNGDLLFPLSLIFLQLSPPFQRYEFLFHSIILSCQPSFTYLHLVESYRLVFLYLTYRPQTIDRGDLLVHRHWSLCLSMMFVYSSFMKISLLSFFSCISDSMFSSISWILPMSPFLFHRTLRVLMTSKETLMYWLL